jgi:hypothetical protein
VHGSKHFLVALHVGFVQKLHPKTAIQRVECLTRLGGGAQHPHGQKTLTIKEKNEFPIQRHVNRERKSLEKESH